MMSGQFREYNWRDIQRLIAADAGLTTDEERRMWGQFWYVGSFVSPEHELDTCVRVQVFDKPANERMKEHAERPD